MLFVYPIPKLMSILNKVECLWKIRFICIHTSQFIIPFSSIGVGVWCRSAGPLVGPHGYSTFSLFSKHMLQEFCPIRVFLYLPFNFHFNKSYYLRCQFTHLVSFLRKCPWLGIKSCLQFGWVGSLLGGGPFAIMCHIKIGPKMDNDYWINLMVACVMCMVDTFKSLIWKKAELERQTV